MISADGSEHLGPILHRFEAALKAQPGVRFLELQGSLARGAADRYSDIDMRIGIDDDTFEKFEAIFYKIIRGFGGVLQILRHDDPDLADIPNKRWFILYADGTQLDCVLVPLSTVIGSGPQTAVLYDPDSRGAAIAVPVALDGGKAKVEEWAALAWVALIDVYKYLARGALWEAYMQTAEIRTNILRLWAVAKQLNYPALGIVAIFDSDNQELPPGLGNTVGGLSRAEIKACALACLELLDQVIPEAARTVGAVPSRGFGDWLRPRLQAVEF
jgi:hypothetical protein